jgi:hypothetical protein
MPLETIKSTSWYFLPALPLLSLLSLSSSSPRQALASFQITSTLTMATAKILTSPKQLHGVLRNGPSRSCTIITKSLPCSAVWHPETPRFALTEIKTETFELSVTFCAPKQLGPNSRKVLVATHGVGFDRRYWAPAFDDSDTYNFVKTMLGAGYPVLYYDRLGVGKSQR